MHVAHAEALARHGGADGLVHPQVVDWAVYAPQSGWGDELAHPTLARMAAALAYPIARSHPFLDGNKRTAIICALAFLDANGFHLQLDPDRWERIMMGVAIGWVTEDDLAREFAHEMGGDVTVEVDS